MRLVVFRLSYNSTRRFQWALRWQFPARAAAPARVSSNCAFWIYIAHVFRTAASRDGHIGRGDLTDRTKRQITTQAISLINKQLGNIGQSDCIEGGGGGWFGYGICTCHIDFSSIFIATPGPQGPRFGCRPFTHRTPGWPYHHLHLGRPCHTIPIGRVPLSGLLVVVALCHSFPSRCLPIPP